MFLFARLSAHLRERERDRDRQRERLRERERGREREQNTKVELTNFNTKGCSRFIWI